MQIEIKCMNGSQIKGNQPSQSYIYIHIYTYSHIYIYMDVCLYLSIYLSIYTFLHINKFPGLDEIFQFLTLIHPYILYSYGVPYTSCNFHCIFGKDFSLLKTRKW